MFKDQVIERILNEFGEPSRTTAKVKAWDITQEIGLVIQTDSPNKVDHAFVWLPYPPENGEIPEVALEYAGETGRHSNTYASPGLEKGKPALKLIITSPNELDDLIQYIIAYKSFAPLPKIKSNPLVQQNGTSRTKEDLQTVDVDSMPKPQPKKTRRKAIPRTVQREVWQRDGGMCVECGSKAYLCFDHIVPFSKGGSNTVRNIQLLCENCNLSKGNRI
ncbi:hypothetical protein DGMP_26030 [Desulfomarina profundi]|uniref:HNH nuclease domain-containing protein n=1 Tax=Desulfomarina profundi TaxID=2772557 RepID=A0A8D5JQ21_9BACT|nr:HNH endonuclease [Desulfomarina profundi]BCL61910.1 hypothetical protein DGMP_26030 [Desulfomarina profundi]